MTTAHAALAASLSEANNSNLNASSMAAAVAAGGRMQSQYPQEQLVNSAASMQGQGYGHGSHTASHSHSRGYGSSPRITAGGHTHAHPIQHAQAPNQHRGQTSRNLFMADLTSCLYSFVIQLLPTPEEVSVKEDVRKLLERLIRSLEPNSRLLSFGSTANGFALRNSDMDLCCLIDSEERLAATDLVTMLGDLLERETKFHVKPLPLARIPIVKLSLDPSPGLPLGIACDIGFENRLALENTRLLMCYAMIDPHRVRTLVLFLKVWCKRRNINSPYLGTLSSYGYVLLVIFFLVHVKNPPVLPNLQAIPPLRPIPPEEHHMGEYNIWFFDDIDLLRQRWQSENKESVGELLVDFFRYYARHFPYTGGVASIRSGLLTKDVKGWMTPPDKGRPYDPRERNRFCVEDPFEADYNVARCVTREGLYKIRGEFMRALRILNARPERAYIALTELCEEARDDEPSPSPAAQPFIPSRVSIPPQTPYAVGSGPLRRPGAPEREKLSPPKLPLDKDTEHTVPSEVPVGDLPDHMAPKRSKWTSPPPPEAPPDDHTSFETSLGLGLSMATISTPAREEDKYYLSSSNSEISTDDEQFISDIGGDDDARSVRSFAAAESSPIVPPESFAGPSSIPHQRLIYQTLQQRHLRYEQIKAEQQLRDPAALAMMTNRGRHPSRYAQQVPMVSIPQPEMMDLQSRHGLSLKMDSPRRSTSGPSRMNVFPRSAIPYHIDTAASTPLPPSPTVPIQPSYNSPNTIYYETPSRHLKSGATVVYSSTHSTYSPPGTTFPMYQQQQYRSPHSSSFPPNTKSSSTYSSTNSLERGSSTRSTKIPPGSLAGSGFNYTESLHSHNTSTSTIVAPKKPRMELESEPGSRERSLSPPPIGTLDAMSLPLTSNSSNSELTSQSSSPGSSSLPSSPIAFGEYVSDIPNAFDRLSLSLQLNESGRSSPTSVESTSPPSSNSSRSRPHSIASVSPLSVASPRSMKIALGPTSPMSDSVSPPGTALPFGRRGKDGLGINKEQSQLFTSLASPQSQSSLNSSPSYTKSPPLTPNEEDGDENGEGEGDRTQTQIDVTER